MNKEEAEKLYGLLQDLGWEYQRMSTDGQTTLNEIYEMVGIEPMEDDRHLDIDYMMNKVEDKDYLETETDVYEFGQTVSNEDWGRGVGTSRVKKEDLE
tara:strand:- start:155 stop:448 length:294 start_codon:yes stop_codon:yes gene_type:complete